MKGMLRKTEKEKKIALQSSKVISVYVSQCHEDCVASINTQKTQNCAFYCFKNNWPNLADNKHTGIVTYRLNIVTELVNSLGWIVEKWPW